MHIPQLVQPVVSNFPKCKLEINSSKDYAFLDDSKENRPSLTRSPRPRASAATSTTGSIPVFQASQDDDVVDMKPTYASNPNIEPDLVPEMGREERTRNRLAKFGIIDLRNKDNLSLFRAVVLSLALASQSLRGIKKNPNHLNKYEDKIKFSNMFKKVFHDTQYKKLRNDEKREFLKCAKTKLITVNPKASRQICSFRPQSLDDEMEKAVELLNQNGTNLSFFFHFTQIL